MTVKQYILDSILVGVLLGAPFWYYILFIM